MRLRRGRYNIWRNERIGIGWHTDKTCLLVAKEVGPSRIRKDKVEIEVEVETEIE